MDDFYVYGCSAYSLTNYPDNKANDFIVELPYKLVLTGAWSTGLVDIHIHKKDDSLSSVYLNCDGIKPSYTNGVALPILKRLTLAKGSNIIQCNPVQYIHVKPYFQQTTIQLTILDDETLQPVSFIGKTTRCTLHFKRV